MTDTTHHQAATKLRKLAQDIEAGEVPCFALYALKMDGSETREIASAGEGFMRTLVGGLHILLHEATVATVVQKAQGQKSAVVAPHPAAVQAIKGAKV